MKAEQRRAYRAMTRQLARESKDALGDDWLPFALCHLCRYEYIVRDDEGECTHPLEVVQEGFYDVWAGVADCWGFRPKGRTPDESAENCRRWIEEEAERRADEREAV